MLLMDRPDEGGKLAALELELERAHHVLDKWGVPREVLGEDGRPLELSLSGRLELMDEDEDEEQDQD